MSDMALMMFFVGFSAGCWLAFFTFVKFLAYHEKKAAHSGFIEIDAKIWRIEPVKDSA